MLRFYLRSISTKEHKCVHLRKTKAILVERQSDFFVSLVSNTSATDITYSETGLFLKQMNTIPYFTPFSHFKDIMTDLFILILNFV